MDFEFTDDQRMIRDAVRNYSRAELAPRAAQVDRQGRFPIERVRELSELGFVGMTVPEEYGGTLAGALALSLSLTEIAAGDASVAVIMSVSNMVAEAIWRLGTEAQRRRFIPMICHGEYPVGGFALTEAQAGSDATNLRTRAVRDGGHFVLNGTKTFITSAAFASVYIVMARASDEPGSRGITALLVERGAPGMSVGKEEKKMGLNGSQTCELSFEDCRVPAENVLSGEGQGFRVAMTALDGGRIGVASQAIGIASAAMAVAVDYAKQRVAFGKPISELQAIQWKFADMATQLDAARLLVWRAAWRKDNKLPFTREASMAKLYAAEAANRACKEAVQILGGYGYCADYPVERHFRDARVTTIYEGTSEIQRIVIARHVLGE